MEVIQVFGEIFSSAARADFELELSDHRQLVKRLHDLEIWLDGPIGDAARWPGALAARLSEVAGLLQPHFRREEESPLFQELPAIYPRFAARLDRLMEEHEIFAKDFDCIIRHIEDLRDPGAEHIAELVCKAKLAIASLRRHESEENEILQRAYCEDLGACD